MDYSSYLKIKAQAANNYKSNWKARDASEVIMRKRDIAASGSILTVANCNAHQGPDDHCKSCAFPITSSTNTPNNGFSTDYTRDYTLTLQKAGAANCADSNWGTTGGVYIKSTAEQNTILSQIPYNPVKSSGGGISQNTNFDTFGSNFGALKCNPADPGVNFHQIYDPNPRNPNPTLQRVSFPSG